MTSNPILKMQRSRAGMFGRAIAAGGRLDLGNNKCIAWTDGVG